MGHPHWLLVEPIGLLRVVDPPPSFLLPLNFEVRVLLPVNAGQKESPAYIRTFIICSNTSIYEASPVVLKAEQKLLFSSVLATCCNCCASSMMDKYSCQHPLSSIWECVQAFPIASCIAFKNSGFILSSYMYVTLLLVFPCF